MCVDISTSAMCLVSSPSYGGNVYSPTPTSGRKFGGLRIKPFDLAKLSISLDFSKVTAVLSLKKLVTAVLLAEVISGKVTALLLEQKK